MSVLCLEVKGFGGASVEEAVKEMAATASRLGLWVSGDLNGIHVLASPDDNPETLWRNYQLAAGRKAKLVSANVIPMGSVETAVSK